MVRQHWDLQARRPPRKGNKQDYASTRIFPVTRVLSLSLSGLLTAAVSSARREHSDSLHHPSTTAQRFSHSGELVCLYSRVHDHFRHNDIAAKHQ